VQLARELGAEVWATASPGKQHALRAAGVPAERIASSRTLEFAERFAKVDVVLNSLTGDAIDASLGLLTTGGRFLELGKTDRRDPAEVAARFPGTGYRAYDVRDPGPDRIQQMFRALAELFERGALRPPPLSVWDVRQAPEAFRWLAEARHVGKVVLDLADPGRPWDPGRTVLITGGLGFLGRLTARHLVAVHGVRDLILLGRGAPSAEAQRDLDDLRRAGADVRVVAADAADRAALAQVLAAEGPRIGGVVHAAGVVGDGLLTALAPEQLDRVLRPKIDGARNLDELTRGLDLSAFVLFSSAAGVLGSAGQSGYAAANSYLDGLAERRRAAGRPAVSIAWGLWSGGGMGAGLRDADTARMARAGVAALEPDHGLRLLDAALRRNAPVAVAASWDVAAPVPAPAPAVATPAAPAGDRLLDTVLGEIAAVLGHASAAAVDPAAAFDQIGFDSLTAVELRNRLTRATGLRLPATFTYDWPTPAGLAEHLRTELRDAEGTDAGPADGREIGRLEAALGEAPLGAAVRSAAGERLRDLLEKLDVTSAEEPS